MSQNGTSKHEMQADDREFIYIPDDEGNEEEFEVIMYFDVDSLNKRYIIVAPTEAGDDEEDMLYAFSYEEDGDDLKLYPITDDKEWEIVIDTYNTIVSEINNEESGEPL